MVLLLHTYEYDNIVQFHFLLIFFILFLVETFFSPENNKDPQVATHRHLMILYNSPYHRGSVQQVMIARWLYRPATHMF